MSDLIDRQAAIDAVAEAYDNDELFEGYEYRLEALPSAEPERERMSNKEWVDFLSEQFTVSRTSAREMLHGLMKCKAEDNFKKQYSGARNEKT